MMFGYSDEWWVLLFFPVVWWVPFGPFAMGIMGWWCASRPGRRPRLWSVLLPLEPVAVSTTAMVLPLSGWDDPARLDDVLGFLAVYVGGITLFPWLLVYGITRARRALRSRRSASAGAAQGPADTAAEG
ncbi:hypothetical protein EAO71_37440 [Streptomyces sp. ms191]|uniref:hypothetical protein n=1 Tax=Streptomyces sp. ms191 TaxID=1827978 RepID=UPI0011CE6164|nr:hypothetical protein [Streptomyces sp. ms191]TXS08177.1 hypothetical protein EAO71_37440 [Streptomyces sp. ms191]